MRTGKYLIVVPMEKGCQSKDRNVHDSSCPIEFVHLDGDLRCCNAAGDIVAL